MVDFGLRHFQTVNISSLSSGSIEENSISLSKTIALPQENFAVPSSPISGKVATDHLELLEPFIWREFRDNHLVGKKH